MIWPIKVASSKVVNYQVRLTLTFKLRVVLTSYGRKRPTVRP